LFLYEYFIKKIIKYLNLIIFDLNIFNSDISKNIFKMLTIKKNM
jgi:hypothetical protein